MLLILATALLSAIATACGGGQSAPPVDAPENAVWRTDFPSGGNVGQVAPNAYVTLRDGTTTTLEQVAGGKPMLLYYFATW